MFFSVVFPLIVLIAIFYKFNVFKFFYVVSKTYKRDYRGFRLLYAVAKKTKYVERNNATVLTEFEKVVTRAPYKVLIHFEGQRWTTLDIEHFSNQIANYFEGRVKKGDCVALLLENRPEYPAIWLGLSKLGVVAALINTNLVKGPLLHSIRSANCVGIIFGSNYSEAVRDIGDDLKGFEFYQYHEEEVQKGPILPNSVNLREKLEKAPKDPPKAKPEIKFGDTLFFIYTSGTTGFPKAAPVAHARFIAGVEIFKTVTNLGSDDVAYNCLPLYHTSGGVLGVGPPLILGVSSVLRKKFSASNYWKDCAKYNCTVSQYIGEMCRYILSVPENENVKHNVRALFGNGLKPKIWTEFARKFNVKEICELYGSTEGITNLFNLDSTVGSVGFIPVYLEPFFPFSLIKCDEATAEPIRDENGRCIKCKAYEAGLIIGKIYQKVEGFVFRGYSDQEETKKKLLHDVFELGDAYFNSGDILYKDELGYFYFKDRVGDTFRWKGENVSTNEIEDVISNILKLKDVIVYGVEIPGTEGKAGMAAIVDADKKLDMEWLGKSLRANLPSYAVPLFVRVLDSVPLTGTYKLMKVDLKADAYDVEKVKDRVYFYDANSLKYVQLTSALHRKITAGEMRL